jgi:hypothetical protein
MFKGNRLTRLGLLEIGMGTDDAGLDHFLYIRLI